MRAIDVCWRPASLTIDFQWLSSELDGVSSSGHITDKGAMTYESRSKRLSFSSETRHSTKIHPPVGEHLGTAVVSIYMEDHVSTLIPLYFLRIHQTSPGKATKKTYLFMKSFLVIQSLEVALERQLNPHPELPILPSAPSFETSEQFELRLVFRHEDQLLSPSMHGRCRYAS